MVTIDSFGNRDVSSSTQGSQRTDDPNALFKTVEINDVGIYIGQYFPNTFNSGHAKRGGVLESDSGRRSHHHGHHHPKSEDGRGRASYEMVNIVSVRDKLQEEGTGQTGSPTASRTLKSKYLLIYDEKDSQRSLGAWRLEYILKPLTFHLNISHSPVNNEIKGILQVHSITEHTITLRRSHLRPIIFSLQSLNERQERYREILMKNSHLVNLDPVSLKTTTQDEYISLYSRKLRLEAIRLYNTEGSEANFFGIVVQPLTDEEANRLQILDDVLSVRHITKWRCKAREAINRIIIEASSRKKLRNISSDAKSLQMENGNLTVHGLSGVTRPGQDSTSQNSLGIGSGKDPHATTGSVSWTKWAIGKIIGTGAGRDPAVPTEMASSPSYMMQQRGIYSDGDFTVSSSNGLITEEEMDVIMTAVTNEKYFEKIDTPTKFSITFGLAYFSITVFDDVTRPILGQIRSDLSGNFRREMDLNDINTNRNINTKFMESIPNPDMDSEYMSVRLHELYIQLNIQSVIDRNDKDCYDWNFSTYISNLSLYHFRKRILFFNTSACRADSPERAGPRETDEGSNSMESGRGEIKTPSIYNLGSIIRTISGMDSKGSGDPELQGGDFSSSVRTPGGTDGPSSIFLYFTHNVSQEGNSLKFVLKGGGARLPGPAVPDSLSGSWRSRTGPPADEQAAQSGGPHLSGQLLHQHTDHLRAPQAGHLRRVLQYAGQVPQLPEEAPRRGPGPDSGSDSGRDGAQPGVHHRGPCSGQGVHHSPPDPRSAQHDHLPPKQGGDPLGQGQPLDHRQVQSSAVHPDDQQRHHQVHDAHPTLLL
ncbi:hypothetical protein OIY81_2912 [Cryptosporidium canis]|nr:hypothetical protein OIY81_2912 [Cryptosporidium canis]